MDDPIGREVAQLELIKDVGDTRRFSEPHQRWRRRHVRRLLLEAGEWIECMDAGGVTATEALGWVLSLVSEAEREVLAASLDEVPVTSRHAS